MGGHGALTIYLASLSNAKQYRSASAFSPVCNPTRAPWGKKAFEGYLLGGVEEARGVYDATDLIAKIKEPVHILVDYVRTIWAETYLCHTAYEITTIGYGGQFLASTASRRFLESGSGRRAR